MKHFAKISLLTPAFLVQPSGVSALPATPLAANPMPASGPAFSERCRDNNFFTSVARPAEGASIYVVDDDTVMTRLYRIFLEARGCLVSTFNDRARALAALAVDTTGPDLLITDYLGHAISMDLFMERCFEIHPGLRILIASGLSQRDERIFRVKPRRFIQKPFTADEFLRAVGAALAT